MLKHLTIPALGLIVIAGAAAPAMADKGKTYSGSSQYSQSYSGGTVASKSKRKQRKFQNQLDVETKAVWKNLRPSRFVD